MKFFDGAQNKLIFQVWINEEDHLRVISMQKDGDMQACWKRWTGGLQQFENYIKEAGAEYMHSDHLGYILTCPSNLGTYESYCMSNIVKPLDDLLPTR